MDKSNVIQFIKTDIWRIRIKDHSRPKSFLIRLLRVLLLTIRGIAEDKCQLRASSLTYYSLLSIVPVIAMVFGISKGFGFEQALEKLIMEQFEGQEQVAQWIVQFAHSFLQNVKGGLIAGIGIVILFYTIIKILSHIENAFNDVWGISTPRSFTRKITDYLSIILICPVLFIMSSAATVVVTSGVKLIIEKIALLGFFSPLIFFLLKFLPYLVLWILFSFLYIFMPNTKVNFSSGILAGIIAGTIYHLFQWGYIHFQISISTYNAIYGSFAALPFFFIWLQLGWLIVLFGAEISFAHQNVDTYEFEQDCLAASHSFKRLLSLRIVHLLVNRFSDGEKAWTANQISHELEIPIRLVNQLLFKLLATGIISEVRLNDDNVIGYQPAIDPDTLTIKYVISVLDQYGSDNIPVARSNELDRLSENLNIFADLIEKSPANRLLKAI